MSTKILAISTALLASLSLSQVALAEDGKVYPATMCQGSLVGNPPITYYDGRQLKNNSTSNSAVVVCPLIKDNVFSTSGFNEAYLRYYKANSTGFLSTLYSYSAYGTANYVQYKNDFTGAGYKVTSFSPMNSYSQGYYQFVVVIPPSSTSSKSSLISYRMDEN